MRRFFPLDRLPFCDDGYMGWIGPPESIVEFGIYTRENNRYLPVGRQLSWLDGRGVMQNQPDGNLAKLRLLRRGCGDVKAYRL